MTKLRSYGLNLNWFILMSIGVHTLGLATSAYIIHNRLGQDIVIKDTATVISLGMMAAIASEPMHEAPKETTQIKVPLPLPKPKKKPVVKTLITKKPAIKQYEPPVVFPPKQVRLSQTIPPQIQESHVRSALPPTRRMAMAAGTQINSAAKVETGIGNQAGAASLRDIYDARISRHLKKFKRYPTLAKRRKLQGTVKIEFEINREGEVLSVNIVAPRPNTVLKQAAFSQVRRASPFPSPPDALNWDRKKYIVLIDFELKDM